MFVHIPLWKSFRNEKTQRLYLRLEFAYGRSLASGGRNKDGSLKIYRRGYHLETDISVTHGKVEYTILQEW